MAVIRGSKRDLAQQKSGDAHKRAEAIIRAAQEAGEAELDAARQEIKEMVDEAITLGHSEGVSEAENFRQEIAGLSARMVKEIEGEIVRAALDVARHIISYEREEREEAIIDIVRAALSSVRDAREVFLRVNPNDAPILRAQKTRLVDALSRAREVSIRIDRKVTPGGVLIQTESGVIDAQLETQLEEIETVLGL